MKKIIVTFVGMALICFFFLTSSAMAWRGGMGRGMGGCGWGWGPGSCMLFSLPNLTEDQSLKMADIQKNFIKENSKLKSDLAVKRIELNQLLAQPQTKTDEVMAKQKELSNLQSQLQQQCLRNQLEMRKILTDEQLSQLPYGLGSDANYFPGLMRGYVPLQGQGFSPGRGGAWGNRWGRRPCWW